MKDNIPTARVVIIRDKNGEIKARLELKEDPVQSKKEVKEVKHDVNC